MLLKTRQVAQWAGLAMIAGGWSVAAQAQIDQLSRFEKRPDTVDPLVWHVSDPQFVIAAVQPMLTETTDAADRKFAESLLERLRSIQRPRTVELSLEDALHRALANSYTVRVASYNPAISRSGLVQAEAVFDAIYFMSLSNNNVDRPTGSQLIGTKSKQFDLSGGIRKLLPSGMQVSTSLSLQRQSSNNQFQVIDPIYTSNFVGEFTQPLLRNAGIDFNRSQIRIARNDTKVSRQAFKRQVRETLATVEQLYWALVRTRREVTIRARLLTEFEKIYDFLDQRRGFDTYLIQLSQTKANLEASRANFIVVVNEVYNAEDRLIAAINDPELNLAENIEIIPQDFPTTAPVEYDPVAQVQSALDNRSEIAEARLQIDSARIRVGAAKNQALPRLDLLFRYTVNGLGTSADDAFDQVTQTDFTEFLVGLDLEVPIGNRAAEAALRQAQLQHAQQIAALKGQIEQVILDVNVALRAIKTTHELIEPSLQEADANEDQVASVIARAERKNFTALNQELQARNALAESRSALLRALVEYNLSLIELERAKGTLLEYNNVSFVGDDRQPSAEPDTPN
jgi:outer membrane protein TolC